MAPFSIFVHNSEASIRMFNAAFITAAMCFLLGITVWAKKSQILWAVISMHPINMV
jgi:hypothetical protein